SWGTFLRNHLPQIAAMDLFVVPTIGFNLLYVMVIVRLARRELVWINVTAYPTAEWIARQITEAFPWNEVPRYLIRDRDGIYGVAVTRRLRAMGIRDKPIAAGSPWQNSFAERLIGTIRRECVDHIVVLGEAHLRRILREYARYYNTARTHRSFDQDAPVSRPVQQIGRIVSYALVGGLHHQYVRIRFSARTPAGSSTSVSARRLAARKSRLSTIAAVSVRWVTIEPERGRQVDPVWRSNWSAARSRKSSMLLRRSTSVRPSATRRSSSTERISEPSCSFWLRFCASSLSSRSRCTRSAARWKRLTADHSRSSGWGSRRVSRSVVISAWKMSATAPPMTFPSGSGLRSGSSWNGRWP